MKKTQILGLAAILMVGLVAAGALALGPRNAERTTGNWKGQQAAIESALEAGDYNAWLIAINESGRHPPFVGNITEENFAKFSDMHEAMQAGDFEKATEFATELGIERGPRGGQGNMRAENGQDRGMRSGYNKISCPNAD